MIKFLSGLLIGAGATIMVIALTSTDHKCPEPKRCKHGKQWEQFMYPKKYPAIQHLEDGTVIIHQNYLQQ